MIKMCKKRSRLGMDIDNNTLTERELFKIKIKYEIHQIQEKGLLEFQEKLA